MRTGMLVFPLTEASTFLMIFMILSKRSTTPGGKLSTYSERNIDLWTLIWTPNRSLLRDSILSLSATSNGHAIPASRNENAILPWLSIASHRALMYWILVVVWAYQPPRPWLNTSPSLALISLHIRLNWRDKRS